MRVFVMRIIFSDTRVDNELRWVRTHCVVAPTPADAVNLLTKPHMANVEVVDFVDLPTDRMGSMPLDSSVMA